VFWVLTFPFLISDSVCDQVEVICQFAHFGFGVSLPQKILNQNLDHYSKRCDLVLGLLNANSLIWNLVCDQVEETCQFAYLGFGVSLPGSVAQKRHSTLYRVYRYTTCTGCIANIGMFGTQLSRSIQRAAIRGAIYPVVMSLVLDERHLTLIMPMWLMGG